VSMEDGGAHSDAIYIVPRGSGLVDLTSRSRQQSFECGAWQVKIDKVEKVIKAKFTNRRSETKIRWARGCTPTSTAKKEIR
jgi:hypothetical protein